MSRFFGKFAAFTALLLVLFIDPVVSYKRDITTWSTASCGVSKAESVPFYLIKGGI